MDDPSQDVIDELARQLGRELDRVQDREWFAKFDDLGDQAKQQRRAESRAAYALGARSRLANE